MKVLCICPGYYPAFEMGGVVASVHGLNKELVKQNIEVTVYATNNFLEDKVVSNVPVNVDGVTVIYFDFNKQFEFISNNGWQFSVSMWKMVRTHITEYDVVHIHSIWNFPVALAAYYCRKHGIPYVITPRGMLYPYTIKMFAWRKLPYYWLIAKRDVQGAALVHYTTEDEANKCHSFLKLKNSFIVIPNGIDLVEYSNLPSHNDLRKRYKELEGKIVVLFLGRINGKKGFDILIEAFSQVYETEKRVHLLIVGADECGYLKTVISMVTKHKLNYADYSGELIPEAGEYQVTYTGQLTGVRKLEAYSGSDIFVLSSYSENFGNTVIEAQVCGLPVVVSDQTGASELIKKWDTGLIVQTDAQSISKALKTMVSNPESAKNMGSRGKAFVLKQLSWGGIAHQMSMEYKCISANTPGGRNSLKGI
jgi:glycosyltransferase involved in cell wall biosynthesis